MKEVPQAQVLRVSDSVRIAETQDGAVLLDVEQGLCFSINPIGALIWKRVSDGCAIAEIARYLSEIFRVSLEQARIDTQEFIEVLMVKGLVKDQNHKNSGNGRRGWIQHIFSGLWKMAHINRTRRQE